MTTPVWGTPPTERREYAVIGFYLANGQRWRQNVVADTAREAEDLAKAELDAEGEPQVCGVVYAADGSVVTADTYATYLDPDMVDIAYLRPPFTYDLAKTGDSDARTVLCQYTLESRNEKASGKVSDVNPAL